MAGNIQLYAVAIAVDHTSGAGNGTFGACTQSAYGNYRIWEKLMKLIFFLPFLLIGITPVFAETGYDYFDVLNPDGTHTWSTHEPYLFDGDSWVPYIYSNGKVNTEGISVQLNSNGTYSLYKDDTLLLSDYIIAKYADISDLNTWTYPNTLNNDTPDISWNGSAFISSKLKSGVGLLDYKFVLIDGKWKTQLEATNLSALTTKAFGFDEIFDLKTDVIDFGNQQRNLDNFNGTTFNKAWLIANKGKVINFLNGLGFDFDKGFDDLYSVTVYDTGVNKSRLVFDYRTSTPLLPNEKLVIDPTVGYTAGTWKRYNSVLTSGGDTNCALLAVDEADYNNQGVLRSDNTGGRCQAYTFVNNISSLPTTVTVTSATIRFDVSAVSSPNACDVFAITTANPDSAAKATVWADIFAGNQYVTDSTTCDSTGNDKTVVLSSLANTDIRNLRLASTQNFTFSMVEGNWDAISGTSETTLNLATGSVDLEIVYSVASPPDRINDLTYANLSTNALDLLWTQPNLNGGNLTNYLINYTTPFGNPQTFLANTTNTYYNVTGLIHGTDYSFRVSALTEAGYNATGNILNVTTTSTTYSNPPTLTAFGPSSASTQINLEFPGSTMNNINGYRIQRETPIGAGWVNLGTGNTSSSLTYYNDTGLSSNVIYNYRVYAMNGSGISTVSNEYDMTTFHLPDAVTDLDGSATDLSTIDLSWSAPTSYAPEIIGYMINGTTPTGEPVDVLNANTGSASTTATAFNLLIGQEYSFRVSPITVHGYNGSGNIWNGSTLETFVIGDLSSPDVTNDDDFSIFFDRTDVNSSAIQLDVTYPNSYDLSCDFSYKYARTNQTYTGLTTVPNGTDNQVATFTLINATGDLVQVRCWDVLTGDESIYVITITDFPFLQYVNNLRNGEYGTFFQIGAFDGVMLVVIFLGMIGLNRTTPIVGITFVVITTFALSYFGFITYPVIMYPALIMMIVWAFVTTRKDD